MLERPQCWCRNDCVRVRLVVSSRSVRRQPEKLGRRWWKVWNKVLPGDRCRQSRVLVDQVCQQHEWVVPGIVARYHEGLCSSVLQSYTACAPGPAASEGWRVHLWCGRSVSDWRSAVPLHSEPTGVGALDGQEYPPTRFNKGEPIKQNVYKQSLMNIQDWTFRCPCAHHSQNASSHRILSTCGSSICAHSVYKIHTSVMSQAQYVHTHSDYMMEKCHSTSRTPNYSH